MRRPLPRRPVLLPAVVWLAVVLLPRGAAGADPPDGGEPSFAGRPLKAWIADLADTNPLAREEALEVIARFGRAAKEAAPAVRPLLKDAVPTVRLRAAITLWRVGGKTDEVAPVLAEAMRQSGARGRVLGLDTLAWFDPATKGVADALVECLADNDRRVRTATLKALRQMGADAVPVLAKAVGHKDAETVRHALGMLRNLGERAAKAAAPVRARLMDKDAGLRVLAAQVLWQIARDAKTVAPILIEAAGGDDPRLRREALHTLLLITPKPRAAVPILEAALKEKNVSLRVMAAKALFEMDGRTKDTLPVLLGALKDPHGRAARVPALRALGAMGAAAREVVPAVADLLREEQGPTAPRPEEIAGVLTQLSPSVPTLIRGLVADKNPRVRAAAILALGRIGGEGLSDLLKAYPAADAADRGMICRALRQQTGQVKESVPILARAVTDPDPELSWSALLGLYHTALRGPLGPSAKEAVPALLEVVKDGKRPQRTRLKAADLLARIGPAGGRAVPGLTEVLKDAKEDAAVREQAAKTLGLIGPAARNALPELLKTSRAGPPLLRVHALRAVWSIDPSHKAVVPGLVPLLTDREARAAGADLQAAALLYSVGQEAPAAVPALIEALKAAPVRQRRQFLMTLWRVGAKDERTVPALKEQLGEKAPGYLVNVAFYLIRLGAANKESVPLLVKAAADPKAPSRYLAFLALEEMGPAAAPAAKKLLPAWRAERSLQPRVRLAEVLAALDPEVARETVPWLREQMTVPPNSYSCAAAVVAYKLDPADPRALAYLRKLLAPGSHYRGQAAQELGRAGPAAQAALPDLEATLKNLKKTESGDRLLVVEALWRVDPKHTDKAVAVLVELMQAEKIEHPNYRRMAALTLRKMGADARAALPALVKTYHKADSNLRYAILEAVCEIDPAAIAKLSPP